jgi:hypothetical protein
MYILFISRTTAKEYVDDITKIFVVTWWIYCNKNQEDRM